MLMASEDQDKEQQKKQEYPNTDLLIFYAQPFQRGKGSGSFALWLGFVQSCFCISTTFTTPHSRPQSAMAKALRKWELHKAETNRKKR